MTRSKESSDWWSLRLSRACVSQEKSVMKSQRRKSKERKEKRPLLLLLRTMLVIKRKRRRRNLSQPFRAPKSSQKAEEQGSFVVFVVKSFTLVVTWRDINGKKDIEQLIKLVQQRFKLLKFLGRVDRLWLMKHLRWGPWKFLSSILIQSFCRTR